MPTTVRMLVNVLFDLLDFTGLVPRGTILPDLDLRAFPAVVFPRYVQESSACCRSFSRVDLDLPSIDCSVQSRDDDDP